MLSRRLQKPAGKLSVSHSGSEQRRHERVPVVGEWSVALHFGEGDAVRGRAVDASGAGLGVELTEDTAANRLVNGQALVISVETPERVFARKARLRWSLSDGRRTRLAVSYEPHPDYAADSHTLAIESVRIDPVWALKIPANLALRRRVLPFVELGGVIQVACTDPDDGSALTVVERLLKRPLQPWMVERAALERVIRRVYGDSLAAAAGASAPAAEGQDAVMLGDDLMYAAWLRGASDIHLDPSHNALVIRFRVDGRLETYAEMPASAHSEIVSRFKVLSGLDIAEKRSPQDGRFTHQFGNGGRRVDVRAATLPTKYGERMTLRLLAMETESLTLDRLGLEPDHRNSVERFLRRSQGMMILTGPTGSGKTTTLYAAIRMLLEERRVNIITVEDPIEYEIAGVAQVEVDQNEKVSFAKALRSILRHDPDVVMIGEIRDRETADIAMKASLTGHMVLGTLHTNSSAATVTRLLDMGVEPYLVAATLRLAVAQRLVRRLCRHCRIARALTPHEALLMNQPQLAGRTVYEACGCLYCADRGFSGRIGLYEVLDMTAAWSRLIAEGGREAQLVEAMTAAKTRFLVDDAVSKLLAGETSVGEALPIVTAW